MKLLLKQVNYKSPDDFLIILGDLIDRGPNSVGMIKMARRLEKDGAKILKGNHEIMFLMYLAGHLDEEHYFRNGGNQTIQSYVETYQDGVDDALTDDITWLSGLPAMFELKNYVFTHAGFDPTKPLYSQDVDNFLWGDKKKRFLKGPTGIDKFTIIGHYQASALRSDKQPRVWLADGKMCINTGADMGQFLSLVELPAGIVYATQTVKTPFPNPNIEKLYKGEVITYKVGE